MNVITEPGVGDPQASSQDVVVGDLGAVVLRAILEHGIGYVVSSWRDRPTPIDAAIDQAREQVLSPRGVVLRRLRSASTLTSIVSEPIGGIDGEPTRGLVVFAGQHGLRPTIEQFLSTPCSGAVVGICHDVEALLIEDAIVIDPVPTAVGIMDAFGKACAASVASGRPAIIVIGERALGMRGAVRPGVELGVRDAARADAATRATTTADPTWELLEQAHLTQISDGVQGAPAAATRGAILAAGPVHHAIERACAHIAALLPSRGAAQLMAELAIVSTTVAGVVPTHGTRAAAVLAEASDVLVTGSRAVRRADRTRLSVRCGRLTAESIDTATTSGEEILATIAAWLGSIPADGLTEADRAVLAQLADPRPREGRLVGRVPRRGAMIHRSITPEVAAALALAQGVIGVPARPDPAYPTYQTQHGVAITIVPAATFAARGAAAASPAAQQGGVWLISPADADVVTMASAMGARVEHVDASSPRTLARAIATACIDPSAAHTVIVATSVQRVAAPSPARFGVDPELVGTDRLATAALPGDGSRLIDLGDELLPGPSVIAIDTPSARASAAAMRELSPATWELTRARAAGRGARGRWGLHRRMLRSIAGAEL